MLWTSICLSSARRRITSTIIAMHFHVSPGLNGAYWILYMTSTVVQKIYGIIITSHVITSISSLCTIQNDMCYF